ncbi:hypothetical protein FXO38_07530 [Capsicum annuum]|nr:hypothetical protein FXO38_07530 [Capsicum annuum]
MSRSVGEEDEKTKLDLDGNRKELGGKIRTIDLPDQLCPSFSYEVLPDFSSTLRKENRKPLPTMLPTLKEKSVTLPSFGAKNGKFYGVVRSIGDSKLVNSVKNRIGGLMTRKSYANVEELKRLASVARTSINGENRVGRTNRVSGRTLLGYRQL